MASMEVTPESLAAEITEKGRGWEWPRNYYQERPMEESQEFSPGDFRYERSGDEECRLVGWAWDKTYEADIPVTFPE